jgi:DNA-directed RNA polymerase subunit RPC12/RpoP
VARQEVLPVGIYLNPCAWTHDQEQDFRACWSPTKVMKMAFECTKCRGKLTHEEMRRIFGESKGTCMYCGESRIFMKVQKNVIKKVKAV